MTEMEINTSLFFSLDRPEITHFLFHPRRELRGIPCPEHIRETMIPVADDTAVGAAFHMHSGSAANILFFHGNGEIVADYHQQGAVYTQRGINFLVADYRGYGKSGGEPLVSAMMADSHKILAFVRDWLASNYCRGPLIVMGRSLGSASALELAARHPEDIDGLILESGFFSAARLLRKIGVPLDHPDLTAALCGPGTDHPDITEPDEAVDRIFGHARKISDVICPTVIIHARQDHIIPYADGEALFAVCPVREKKLIAISDADHNNLMHVGFDIYLDTISDLAETLKRKKREKTVVHGSVPH